MRTVRACMPMSVDGHRAGPPTDPKSRIFTRVRGCAPEMSTHRKYALWNWHRDHYGVQIYTEQTDSLTFWPILLGNQICLYIYMLQFLYLYLPTYEYIQEASWERRPPQRLVWGACNTLAKDNDYNPPCPTLTPTPSPPPHTKWGKFCMMDPELPTFNQLFFVWFPPSRPILKILSK